MRKKNGLEILKKKFFKLKISRKILKSNSKNSENLQKSQQKKYFLKFQKKKIFSETEKSENSALEFLSESLNSSLNQSKSP